MGPHHDLVVSMGADADLLLPPFVTATQGMEVSDLIFERLAEPDSTLNTVGDRGYTPAIADRWTWSSDSLSIAFHIDPRARWQDGPRVTARDVRYSFEVYRDSAIGAVTAPLLTNIDSVSTPDSSTAVLWFHRRTAEEFYTGTYQMHILPSHLLDSIPLSRLRTTAFARAPVGSGPYRFGRWIAGALIELEADTTYRFGRPTFDRVLFTITPNVAVAFTRLLAHEVDFLDRVSSTDLARLATHPELRVIRWPSLENCMLLFNLDPQHRKRANPTLGDWRVRRAIALALDRHALVESVFGSTARVAQGPLPSVLLDTLFLPDVSPDTATAARLLDAAGWTMDATDHLRHRAGHALRFVLLVPSIKERLAIAVLLQAQLRRIGVDVEIEETEFNTALNRLIKGQFDATLVDLNWDPSPASVRQIWSSLSLSPDGSNFARYVNPRFDSLLNSAIDAKEPQRARGMYRRALATLTGDVPAVWLYDVVNVGVVRRSIEPTGIRADAWWTGIARWRMTQPTPEASIPVQR